MRERSLCAGIMVCMLLMGLAYEGWAGARGVTRESVRARGHAVRESAQMRWNSLSPDQQQFMRERARQAAGKAKTTGEEYWNSLSPEEQQKALEQAREAAAKGKQKWQSIPESSQEGTTSQTSSSSASTESVSSGVTRSQLKATGQEAKEGAMVRWNSLSPEEQAYMKERARAIGVKAKNEGEEYWNSLSPEEQKAALERARQAASKGASKFKTIPQ